MIQPIPFNDITYDTRPYIREMEHYLRIIEQAGQGYSYVTADGFFDSVTTDAVRQVQAGAGLVQDGIIDLTTWNTIYAAMNGVLHDQAQPTSVYVFRREQSTIHSGQSSDEVIVLQIMLRKLGQQYINLPDHEVTGVYDDATALAVTRMQQISGLPQTGTVDKDTWNAITALYNLD